MSKRRFAVLAATVAFVAAGAWALTRQPPAALAPAAVVPSASAYRQAAPLRLLLTIYDGGFQGEWLDGGWGPHEIVDGGPARIGFAGFGGITLRGPEIDSRYAAFSFRYKAPPAFGDFLEVELKGTSRTDPALPLVGVEPRHTALLADGWREVVIGMKELNPSRSRFDRIVIKAGKRVAADWVSLDKIGLLAAAPAASSAGTPVRDVTFQVACNEPAHRIDPMIYGIAHGDAGLGATWNRLGGNTMSRLNWDLGNVWNTGNDWFFENVAGKDAGLSSWLDAGAASGMKIGLVVPMIGWVAKDKTSVGFPLSRFPKQRKHDPERGAGDGYDTEGKPIPPGPPSQTSIPAPPELIGRWVRRVSDQGRAQGARRVHMYILDNEPSLWNETHRDVHPEPVGYDELLERTISYGTEVRKADPEALIAGPAEWGWSGYFSSAKDRTSGVQLGPDRMAHGGEALVAWYLRRLAEHERRTGVRLLDVLILHFYPAGAGVYGDEARTDPETAALRLRSTRALWDPEYQDESWIADRVKLIPRMKAWVRDNYPGRKVALGEWNFGAEDHISGGLAVAEALGRFGQQGLDMASYWIAPAPGTPAYHAFRAYRNFDGRGGRFLDWSVKTSSADGVSLFASRDEESRRMVFVALNLDREFAVRTNIDLSSCGEPGERRAFSFGEGSQALVAEPPLPGTAKGLVELMPPYSLRVIELSLPGRAP